MGTRQDRHDGGIAADMAPLFTDFTYNNLGLPKNGQELPWYRENTPDQWSFIENPLGARFVDRGIGLFLSGYDGPIPNPQWSSTLGLTGRSQRPRLAMSPWSLIPDL